MKETLTLNKGTVITKNRARQYSALLNTNTGIVNISKDVVIVDNHDELQPNQPIHNEGVLNQDSAEPALGGTISFFCGNLRHNRI